MAKHPDGRSNLGIFLMAYLMTLGYQIFYWMILFLIRKQSDEWRGKTWALLIFLLCFTAPVIWFAIRYS